MRPTACLWLAAASLLAPAAAARHPRYGGALRVEMRAALEALDPAGTGDAAARLLPLVFDTLVRAGAGGRLEPGLAISWQHDPDFRRWEFRLRPGVRFHDGAPLSASPAVAASLAAALNGPAVTAADDTLIVRCPRPTPDLPLEAARRGYIFTRTADGAPVGTGPFRLTRWEPRQRAAFAANEDYWDGRPFLDAVEIEMGRAPREQLIALEVGRADLVDLSPNDVRRASGAGRRILSSFPVTVLALVFGPTAARAREAVALSIDRAAIHNVLLGRQGEISGALLPNWLSGYAFLFPAAPDLPRSRRLAAELPPAARTLSFGYDPADPLARMVADRIAVNARDAGIVLQVVPQPAHAAVRLVSLRIESLDPSRALAALGATLPPAETPEALCAAERALLESSGIVPLFHLPEIYGASPRVSTWLEPAVGLLGAWSLADLWLEGAPRP